MLHTSSSLYTSAYLSIRFEVLHTSSSLTCLSLATAKRMLTYADICG
jgi:hypothetical protein